MPTIRIWTLESENDAKAVKCLANKLVTHLQSGNLSIQTAGPKAVPKRNKKGASPKINAHYHATILSANWEPCSLNFSEWSSYWPLEAVLKTRTAFEKLSNQPPDASQNTPYHRYIHPICLIFYFCFRAYNNFKTAS